MLLSRGRRHTRPRTSSTSMSFSTGSRSSTYAMLPIPYVYLVWRKTDSVQVKGVCAIGSTGSLRPKTVPCLLSSFSPRDHQQVPVGSIVMPDDYAFVLPGKRASPS